MDYTKLDKEAQAYAENVIKAARESFIYDLAYVLLDIQLAYKAGAKAAAAPLPGEKRKPDYDLNKEAEAYAKENEVEAYADEIKAVQNAYKDGANRDKYCSATWQEQQATSAAIESALAAGLADIDCLPYLERQATSQGHRV
jgi:hypothetical protein